MTESRFLGFPVTDWLAAAALSEPSIQFMQEVAAERSEQHVIADLSQDTWLALARLSPSHAQRVLQMVEPMWTEWIDARRARIAEVANDPDLQMDFAQWAAELEAELTTLRRLAQPEGGAESSGAHREPAA